MPQAVGLVEQVVGSRINRQLCALQIFFPFGSQLQHVVALSARGAPVVQRNSCCMIVLRKDPDAERKLQVKTFAGCVIRRTGQRAEGGKQGM